MIETLSKPTWLPALENIDDEILEAGVTCELGEEMFEE